MTGTAVGDDVLLDLPALPEYGRIARLAAANLALRYGFSYREVEDIQLAIDESFILLLGHGPRLGQIRLRFHPDKGTITIGASAELTDDLADPDTGSHHRFGMLVTDLVDEHRVSESGRELELVKRHRAVGHSS